MAPERVERLRRIAARTWQRTLDDRLGISAEEYRRKAHDLISEERLNLAVEQSAPPAEPAPVSWAAESIRRLEEQKAAREAAEKPREHPEDRKVRRADLRRARARVLRRRRSMIGTSILLLLAIATFLVWWFGWWSR